MSDLNHAIQLIRQGQKLEAQRILQELLKTQPNNIQAWFWYVETCATTETRIQVLETCLKVNPGNQQVANALQTLRSQKSAVSPKPIQHTPAPPPVQPQPSSFTRSFEERPQSNTSEKDVDAYAAYSSYSSFASPAEPVSPAVPKKEAWELDESEYVDNSLLSKSKKPVRTYSVFDVWMTVLTIRDVSAYEEVLKDPQAGLGRAFTWMAVAGVVNALVFPFLLALNPQYAEMATLPEFQNLNMNAFLVLMTVVMLFLAPLGNIINLAVFGGVQSFLAGFFGGTGNFTRTVYAIAAFSAPITMMVSLVSIIPIVGQCLTFPLSIYSLVLNVRALRAAHSISTGAAIGVIFAPGILIFIFMCLLIFLLGGMNLPQQ